MKIEASSPEEYLQKIPEERKVAFIDLRKAIMDNLPEGFEEAMSYGMIGYVVPLRVYPSGYLNDPKQPLPFISIASQKNFIGFYHMGMYSSDELYEWFRKEYSKISKYKIDMGKSCLRLKRLDDIPFELIGELCSKISMREWIDIYEQSRR